jgi:O-antigen/teichoic acid export membrane protein
VWLAMIFGVASVLDASRFPVELLRLSALAVWFDSILSTNLTAFRASLRNKYSSLLEAGIDGLWLIMTALLIFAKQTQTQIFLGIRVGALFAGVAISTWFVWNQIRPRVAFPIIKHALSESLPFAASELLAWASLRQDVLIVTMMIGNTAAGLYSPAVGIVNAAFLIPGAIYLVTTPVLSNLFATNIRQAWVTAKRSILLSGFIGFAAALGLAAIAGPVVSLLGVTFHGSREILVILSVILIFHSIAFAMAAIVIATGHQAQRTVIQAIVVVINALLNFAVVRWAGIKGVAVVYVITDFCLMIGYSWLVYRIRRPKADLFTPLNPSPGP